MESRGQERLPGTVGSRPGQGGGGGEGYRAGSHAGGFQEPGGPPGLVPLRQMVGGIAAVFAAIWTMIWLVFYLLVELLGNLLVWLSRTVFEAQGLANFFAGLFGFLQGLGFATILVIWLVGMALALGFYLLTRRASQDVEARWWNFRADRARPVQEPPQPQGTPSASAGAGGAGNGDRPPTPPARTGTGGPVTIDLRRDGDTYR